jgi:hypothetical protein
MKEERCTVSLLPLNTSNTLKTSPKMIFKENAFVLPLLGMVANLDLLAIFCLHNLRFMSD